MTHPLFEQLENSGLVRGRRVATSKVHKLSLSRIIDLSAEASELTSAEYEEPSADHYSHAASLSLGGGPSPCETVGCRRKRLDELARFAALYSDRVYIHNFLADPSNHIAKGESVDLGVVRQRLVADLQLLAHVRPLVDAGHLVPLAMPSGRCPHCAVDDSYGPDAAARSLRVAEELRQRYLGSAELSIQRLSSTEYDLSWRGPDEFFEHGGGGRSLTELPDALTTDVNLMAGLDRGERVTLSRTQVEQLNEHGAFVGDLLRSVAFEMSVSQALKASYVTDRSLEVDVLNSISQDAPLAERNRLLERHLTALVPFAADVPVANLLELRKREAESFLLFRQALNTAISEYKVRHNSFGENDARALYGDVIAPRLAALDRQVKVAKKGIVAEVARSIGGWTAAISFGLYSGWVPSGVVAAATALGLTKVAADIVGTGLKLRDTQASIRNDSLYFLWRVRGAAAQATHRADV